MRKLYVVLLIAALSAVSFTRIQSQGLKSPDEFFGFKPGTDRKVFNYEKLIEYLTLLEKSSPRVRLFRIGQSPMGKPMYICCISSADNLKNIDRLKEINRQLALDPGLSGNDRDKLTAEGKVFFLATLSMHSPEVAPSQALPLLAYDMATTTDAAKLKCLDDVVYMAVPCHNPDGMDMVIENYLKYLDTEYEGSSMPGIYHKYAGHDNNRDFISLSQEDSRAIDRLYSKEWFPQVMVEKHQMGSGGVRYFVPPPHDPIAENIDAGVWNWIGIFGSNMMKDMTADGLKGVSQNYLFDDYWPGSTETCIWKNVIGFLTEAASVRVASPVFIEENELETGGKGLSEYKKSINFPEPWKGGWWRLGDIVNYEISSTWSVMRTASANRAAILRFRNDLCRSEVEKGRTTAPFYYVLPADQPDKSETVGLVNLLIDHGIRVYQLRSDLKISSQLISGGSIVIPLSQPFRAFIKEVMEKQKYPVRHYTPGGEVMKPYDIASWSLPLHRGVDMLEVGERVEGMDMALVEINSPFRITKPVPDDYVMAFFPASGNESYKAAFIAASLGLEVARTTRGDFIIRRDKGKKSRLDSLVQTFSVSPEFLMSESRMPVSPFTVPRIALVETQMHDMDAGWTRYVFDTYHIPYKVLHPGDIAKTALDKNFDVVIFPDNDKSVLMEGKYESDGQLYPTSYPPEFTKGIGKKGMTKLTDFFLKGGHIISWGGSTELFTGLLSAKSGDSANEFHLPVRDISKQIAKAGLFCPGSFVKMNLSQDHFLTKGMPESTGIFFRGEPVFSTSIPRFDMDRRVIGKFPEENILLSGYCEKPEILANKSVMVWLSKGKGQMVLFGFCPQFRASTQATYKLLFNAILMP